jgi:hypothetical protein
MNYKPQSDYEKETILHLVSLAISARGIGTVDRRISYGEDYLSKRYTMSKVPVFFKKYGEEALDLDVWQSNGIGYVLHNMGSLKDDMGRVTKEMLNSLCIFCGI